MKEWTEEQIEEIYAQAQDTLANATVAQIEALKLVQRIEELMDYKYGRTL